MSQAKFSEKQIAEILFKALQEGDEDTLREASKVIEDPANNLDKEKIQAELAKLQGAKQSQPKEPPKQAQQQPKQQTQQANQSPPKQQQRAVRQVAGGLPDLFQASRLTGAFRWMFLALLIIVCLLNIQPYIEFFEIMFLANMPDNFISDLFRFQFAGVSPLGLIAGIALWGVIQFIQLRKCRTEADVVIKKYVVYPADFCIGCVVYPPIVGFNIANISFAMLSDIDWKQVLMIAVQLGAVELMAWIYRHIADNPAEMIGSR